MTKPTVLALLLSLGVSLCACGSDAPADPVEAGYKASQEGDHAAAVGHFDAALATLSAGSAKHTEVALARCRERAHLDPAAARGDFMELAGATELEEKAYRDMVRDLFNGGSSGLLEAVNVVDAGLKKFPDSEKLKQYLEKLKAEAAKAEGGALNNALKGLGYT